MTPCVCGHPAEDHQAWTGACNGQCGCSYYLPDNGTEPASFTPPADPYVGIYSNRKWAV